MNSNEMYTMLITLKNKYLIYEQQALNAEDNSAILKCRTKMQLINKLMIFMLDHRAKLEFATEIVRNNISRAVCRF